MEAKVIPIAPKDAFCRLLATNMLLCAKNMLFVNKILCFQKILVIFDQRSWLIMIHFDHDKKKIIMSLNLDEFLRNYSRGFTKF
jgi:hypothetical protein